MVAEKPSLAASIAGILSNGHVSRICETAKTRQLSAHDPAGTKQWPKLARLAEEEHHLCTTRDDTSCALDLAGLLQWALLLLHAASNQAVNELSGCRCTHTEEHWMCMSTRIPFRGGLLIFG